MHMRGLQCVSHVHYYFTFISERLNQNEISAGKISCCHNEAHSCFIDHNMLQIIVSFARSSVHNYARASLSRNVSISKPRLPWQQEKVLDQARGPHNWPQ